MSTKDILMALGVAVGAYLLASRVFARPASSGSAFSSQLDNAALPGQPGWGWQYFTDGVAIGPDGTYYKNGVEVWSPANVMLGLT